MMAVILSYIDPSIVDFLSKLLLITILMVALWLIDTAPLIGICLAIFLTFLLAFIF